MPSLTCPEVFRKVADGYKSACGMSYGALTALFGVSALGAGSLCQAVRENAWMPSVSTLDAALHDFDEQAFMRRLRSSVLGGRAEGFDRERFCFAIDDTLVERFGEEIHARGYHPRHGKGGVTRGQRVIVLSLVDKERGVATPLAFSMCLNKGDKGYISLQDLSLMLTEQVVAAGFPALPVVMDSGFDSMPLMAKFDDKGWTVVIECRSNRKVKRCAAPGIPWGTWKSALGKEMRAGVRLPPTERNTKFRKTKYVASRRVQLKGRGAPVKACAVYNGSSDSEAFAVYATNDLSLTGDEIWALSRARWHIEEMFRTLKQSLGFLKLPVRGEKPCFATICLPFALLSDLQWHPERWEASPEMPFGLVLRRLRQRLLWETIARMGDGKKHISKLVLAKRALGKDNSRKPVNPSADEVRAYFSRAA
jgi:Transposase DDE domain